MSFFTLFGNVVNILTKKISPSVIQVASGKIVSVKPQDLDQSPEGTTNDYILPGFIDAHVHIESSMLAPSEFARLATVHGTVATVSDPHEIANVLGIEGVRYMIQNGRKVPFHFYFGVPSCVPATGFETSGAVIDAEGVQKLFEEDQLLYLSEMMNFPGVLHRDPLVMDKIDAARRHNRPVDGHAPGLMGKDAGRYADAGISTDHECVTLAEALNKIRHGMKILIREGSAAKNYEALHPLIKMHPDKIMFCSDDKHPDELVRGHINQLVARSIIEKGYDTMDVLRAACYAPVEHYRLGVGLLRPGDPADFIIVNNLHDFRVKATYVNGQLVAKNGKPLIQRVPISVVNQFNCKPKQPSDFTIKAQPGKIQVIQAVDGQLITQKIVMDPTVQNGCLVADPGLDVLKIAVINRYREEPVALGFIKGFGLNQGAIASCVAHDSHNIICVGTGDVEMCRAVNNIIENRGGIAAVNKSKEMNLPLPVAGIMSTEDGYRVAEEYIQIDKFAKELGSQLQAPFMTLSFMALLVIPSLKIGDKGLFDVDQFALTDLVMPT